MSLSRSVRESSVFIIVTSLPKLERYLELPTKKVYIKKVYINMSFSPRLFFIYLNLSCRMPVPALLCLFPQEPLVSAQI